MNECVPLDPHLRTRPMMGGHAQISRGLLAVRLSMLLAALVATVPARADSTSAPTTRLLFIVDERVAGCPTEETMRALVATHLGYDPFRRDALWLVRARIEPSGVEIVGRIELEDDRGAPAGGRKLHAPKGACQDLVDSMALATSLALDPVTAPRRPSPVPVSPPSSNSPPPDPVAVTPSVPEPATPIAPPPPRPSSPFTTYAVTATQVSLGGTPGTALGFTLGGGVERRWLAIGLEARIDLPSEADSQNGGVEATQLDIAAVACAQTGSRVAVAGCLVAGGGPMWSHGVGVTEEGSALTAHAGVGARVRLALRLTDVLAIGLRAELLAALVHSELSVAVAGANQGVWGSSPVVTTLGPDLSVHFR